MKKQLLTAAIALSSISSIGYANCTMKCISRNPVGGECWVKIKVCTPSVDAATDSLKKSWDDLTREWHRIYGNALPEKIRNILNTYPCTIIGAASGGLDGAILGQMLDRVVSESVQRFEKTKAIIDQLPPQLTWKEAIYLDGYALVTGRSIQNVTMGQRDKMHIMPGLETAYETFLGCMDAAANMNAAEDCYWNLDDEVDAYSRRIRRSGNSLFSDNAADSIFDSLNRLSPHRP